MRNSRLPPIGRVWLERRAITISGSGLSDDEAKAAYWDEFLSPEAKARERGERRGGGGAKPAETLGCLFFFTVWPTLQISMGYFLAGPAMTALWQSQHSQLVEEGWFLTAGSPLVALLVAWRIDYWRRRPIRWRRMLTTAAAIEVLCLVTGLLIQFRYAGKILALKDPAQIHFATTLLGTATAWVTVTVLSIVLRWGKRPARNVLAYDDDEEFML